MLGKLGHRLHKNRVAVISALAVAVLFGVVIGASAGVAVGAYIGFVIGGLGLLFTLVDG